MRRADRLFAIIQLLRSGRVFTARNIAERLEVTVRTVYRDVQCLISTGVPIEGEPGIGYVLRKGYDLPPLMFTKEEMAALIMGARMVEAWGGDGHGKEAAMALSKIESALPPNFRKSLGETMVFSPAFHISPALKKLVDALDRAITKKTRLKLRYVDEKGEATVRTVRPLALFYWGKVWTLAAWCELRGDFRSFRADRLISTKPGRPYKDEPGRTIEDFLIKVRAERNGAL